MQLLLPVRDPPELCVFLCLGPHLSTAHHWQGAIIEVRIMVCQPSASRSVEAIRHRQRVAQPPHRWSACPLEDLLALPQSVCFADFFAQAWRRSPLLRLWTHSHACIVGRMIVATNSADETPKLVAFALHKVQGMAFASHG